MSYTIAYDNSVFNAISIYQSAGGLLVVCAGNSDPSVNLDNNIAYTTLDSYSCVMIVASSTADQGEEECLSDYSNYGDVVDIAAPGEGIYSTFVNNGYESHSGTSMAAPFVTGAAALIKCA